MHAPQYIVLCAEFRPVISENMVEKAENIRKKGISALDILGIMRRYPMPAPFIAAADCARRDSVKAARKQAGGAGVAVCFRGGRAAYAYPVLNFILQRGLV